MGTQRQDGQRRHSCGGKLDRGVGAATIGTSQRPVARARVVDGIMLYIHKKSPTPITHWDALRHGGPNNLGDRAVRGAYLVLWNVDIVHREGAWHYLFEFD